MSAANPWTWTPDWSSPMVERLEWLTDVFTAFDGTERRASLRNTPRRVLEFAFFAEGAQRRRLEAALYDKGSTTWAVPFWPDGEPIATTIASGATSIPCSPALRDYAVGGLVMLLGADGRSEVRTIASGGIGGSSVTTTVGLSTTWAAGSGMIYPARIARLPASQAVARFTGDVVTGRARMDFQDLSVWTPATEATTYRGAPVMTERPSWQGEPTMEYQRKLAALDFNTGARVFDDESDRPEIVQAFRWFLPTRQKIADFRAFLYARAGKAKHLWVPTWANDLLVTSAIGSAATTFTVANIGYTSRLLNKTHRRDIRIETTGGQVFYRRITGAVVNSSTTETLTIDSALGTAFTAAEIASVSFLALSRMDQDGIEIAWFTGDSAEAAHSLRAIGNGL